MQKADTIAAQAGAVDLSGIINTNESALGSVIMDWVSSCGSREARATLSEDILEVSRAIYYKYMVDSQGKPKSKIYPDVFYRIRVKHPAPTEDTPEPRAVIYIVRDKSKSPRGIPAHMAELDLCSSDQSFKGSLIAEWAYFQNGSAANPFYMDGCDIISKYLETEHPLRQNVYYHLERTKHGVNVFRDLHMSPRQTA